MDDAVKIYEKWVSDHFHKPMDWEGVPQYMHEGIANHFLHGRPTGSFLYHLFCNDLIMAVQHADTTNILRLKNYVNLLFGYAPLGSYGSVEAVDKWRKHEGLRHWPTPV